MIINKTLREHFDNTIFNIFQNLSPVLASKYIYEKKLGRRLNLNNPCDFNEKLQWLKLYWQHPLIAKCADKYEVRNYVTNCGCAEILNPLYGVYDDPYMINFDTLPSKFVLKCTHGCDMNIFCNDKKQINSHETRIKLKKWLTAKYGRRYCEPHYDRIPPRVICEKYIETTSDLLPVDYKIYCFNGKARLCLISSNRSAELHTELQYDWVDLQWEKIDIGFKSVNNRLLYQKPECFSDMIYYAEKFAVPFPFVRVDFYENEKEIIFGELTFTPAACMSENYNQYGLKLLGDMLVLPN